GAASRFPLQETIIGVLNSCRSTINYHLNLAANMKIAVVGLGYVGLPLSLQFARSCTEVIGIDVDPQKVELLNKGQSYIKHIESADIAELRTTKKFSASTDFSRIKEVEAVIICVPTPLNKNREPNLS